jgi:hypothetical protein
MSSNRPIPRRYFTVEQANAMLPLVRAIVRDLHELSPDIYSEEVTQVEQEIEKDSRRLREYVEELLKLGVEPKNGPEGLVDFPALVDGKEVYLCWKLGEPEVLFWHDIEAGFAGRQSLTADAGVDSGATSGEGLSDGHSI